MPGPKGKTGKVIKNQRVKPETNNTGIIINPKNLRETINEVRKQIENIKNNKKLTEPQKKLALDIFRGKVKKLQQEIEKRKNNQEDPKIKGFKENTKSKFRK